MEMINDEIKHQIEEMKKCFNDLTYFSSEYYTINHPINGLQKLKLFDFQKEYFKDTEDKHKIIYICARQMGMTTIHQMYCLWKSIFYPGIQLSFITNNKDASRRVVDDIRFAHENLPYWLKKQLTVSNYDELVFRSGSSISFYGLTPNCLRGRDPDEIIIDNMAFASQAKAQAFWDSTYPILAGHNKKIIIFSAPHRKNDFFHNLCVSHGYEILDWSLHPERNDDWMDRMIENIGEMSFGKEYECKFL